MKKISLILLFTVIITTVFAQAPNIQWQKCLGGTGGDQAYSIQQTSDGGYIVAGETSSNNGDVIVSYGMNDYWVIKLSPSGSIQWQKSLGGSDDDHAYYIRQTTDGGYILSGTTQSVDDEITGNHGLYDCWVVKLNDTGGLQWEKCLGGRNFDWGSCIQQTLDGGYIMAGVNESNDGDILGNHGGADYWVVKLSSVGTIQWQKSLGGSGTDIANSIQQTLDGGYIVAGTSESNDGDVSENHGDWDYWIVKLSDTGAIQWQESLGGSGGETASSIIQTSDTGYIISGSTDSASGDVTGIHGGTDAWIVKLSSSGSLQWQKCLGGSNFDLANSIRQTTDGGYIVAGATESDNGDVSGSHGGGNEAWVVKLSSSGSIQWQKCLGGSDVDAAMDIQQTSDDGYIVACITSSVDGDITMNHGDWDIWVVKLNGTNGVNTLTNTQPITIIPNPTAGAISITGTNNTNIKVYNTLGQLIKQANNTDNISIAEFPAGLYFVRVFNELGQMVKQDKIIKAP